MLNRTIALVVLLILAGVAAAEVKITGETKSDPYRIIRLKAEGDTTGAALIWDVSDEGALDVEEIGGRLLLTGKPGTYQVKLRVIRLKDGVTQVESARATVTIGGQAPGPAPGPGPTPPEPEPGPGPGPAPEPAPPAPIKEPGLRVMVVYESADLAKYPLPVHEILRGKEVRDFLTAKCAKDADGRTMAYRFYDQNVDARADSKLWQEALKRPRKSVPWVLVSNGRTGWEGPLPGTPKEFIALVSKYAD